MPAPDTVARRQKRRFHNRRRRVLPLPRKVPFPPGHRQSPRCTSPAAMSLAGGGRGGIAVASAAAAAAVGRCQPHRPIRRVCIPRHPRPRENTKLPPSVDAGAGAAPAASSSARGGASAATGAVVGGRHAHRPPVAAEYHLTFAKAPSQRRQGVYPVAAAATPPPPAPPPVRPCGRHRHRPTDWGPVARHLLQHVEPQSKPPLTPLPVPSKPVFAGAIVFATAVAAAVSAACADSASTVTTGAPVFVRFFSMR